MDLAAREVIDLCLRIAQATEERGHITRTFLSPPMRDVHREIGSRMERLGMQVSVDAAGNLRGCYPAQTVMAPRLIIGSHLDTVRHAGAFDGVLGVILGLALVKAVSPARTNFAIELVGFSEEEGVRFGAPFIGSKALAGSLEETMLGLRDRHGSSLAEAIRSFGLDPARLPEARLAEDCLGFLEFHIEQGPLLEELNYPLGVVRRIVGQSRLTVCFTGKSGHAGTTSMRLRRDALAAAGQWITLVEQEARAIPGLVATVGCLEIEPNAANAIAGKTSATLDVRHGIDEIRRATVERMVQAAAHIAADRALTLEWKQQLDQPAIAMDSAMSSRLAAAVEAAGYPLHYLDSGAGHDAMIIASTMPAAMLFVRSPGGVSHHPAENVLVEDVEAAIRTGLLFLEQMRSHVNDLAMARHR